MYYLWETFTSYHIFGFGLTSTIYLVCYYLLHMAAQPKYAPIAEGGMLISGGTDLSQEGMIKYTWDMLYTTMFIQVRARGRGASGRPVRWISRSIGDTWQSG